MTTTHRPCPCGVDHPVSKYALAPEVRMRIAKMLNMLTNERRDCRRCGRTIWMVMTRPTADGSVKKMPVTDDGISHWGDCPHADEFRGAR